ncbi:hypothetical protein KDA_75650 [Dictyobacter alpinus]|uniref:Uncharacterized protein n=2 Tax=Dictyobacter alpinus TaxID=2014873 RepID=A0A402BL63_9CHLR|nr:hypothetical protein KDA_75650 [Dictyobacter alpinus]
MYVGHFSDEKLLTLLDYGSGSGEMRSELCGPDDQNVLWQIRRFAGTLTLGMFEYRRDGTKYYTRRDGRQSSIRHFQAQLSEKHIRRDQLRWFPWYSYDTYTITGPPPLSMTEGTPTPWGEAESITHVTDGVYWVKTGAHGGFMIAVHRAAQLLSQSALTIGALFDHWLCYEEKSAGAVVIFEHREWCHIFTNPDPVGLATSIIRRSYPQYMQFIEREMMIRLWGSKTREDADLSAAVLGEDTSGQTIAVVISGTRLDTNLVSLACQIAKTAKRKLIIMYILVVPRSLPLKAMLPSETEQADALLTSALHVAEKIGCTAVTEVVQAREAGAAIIEEVQDHQCCLLLIGCERRGTGQECDLGAVLPYVQTKAHCRVWFVIDPPSPQR